MIKFNLDQKRALIRVNGFTKDLGSLEYRRMGNVRGK